MLFEDITEEKEAHENLRESEEKYKQLFDTMSEMFQVIELIYDENGRAIDYYYRQVNPAFEKLVGKTQDQLIDKCVKDIFGIVEDYWINAYEQVDKTGIPISQPISCASHWNKPLSTRKVTRTPLSIQPAKHHVNATVLIASIHHARRVAPSEVFFSISISTTDPFKERSNR